MTVSTYHADSVHIVPELGGFDMIFADPPDNVGLDYVGFVDRFDDYGGFLKSVMCVMAENAPISWMSYNARWYPEVCEGLNALPETIDARFFVQTYTFGANRRTDFVNGYRPLVRLMRYDAEIYTTAVLVESWRQKHGDKRAAGPKMPDDVWHFPRVTGNSKQRRHWCPTQLHEGLYRRAIDFSCLRGARICDMFAGTGTMARVAGKSHDVHLVDVGAASLQLIHEEHGGQKFCDVDGCKDCWI